MESFIFFVVTVFFLIIAVTMLNEKLLGIPNEILLLTVSLIVGVGITICIKTNVLNPSNGIVEALHAFRVDKLLLDGLLCFMLFTGASELKLPELVNNFRPISLLALLTTVIASGIYGLLFWGVTAILGMNIGFTICFLLGAIVSPTDPIAATGILNKLGLSKNVTAVMEGESLFNDGTGVALFIFIKNIYCDSKSSNFFVVMLQELCGAIVVGLAVSFVCFWLIKQTRDPIKHIMLSIFAVAFAYYLCEELDFSGVIASVVCGIYFSTMMDKHKKANADLDPSDYYKDFWKIVDALLNYILYIVIGLSFVFVTRIEWFIFIGIFAIVFNVVARYLGVWVSTLASGQLPDGYKIKPFTILMTWGGMKGGLCLALAMSASEFLPDSKYQFVLFVTYITIIFTTIIQGLTVGKLYKELHKRYAGETDTQVEVVEVAAEEIAEE